MFFHEGGLVLNRLPKEAMNDIPVQGKAGWGFEKPCLLAGVLEEGLE